MNPTLALVLFLVALGLTFDFLNGFHDAANSVATVVTTRVLSPPAAVFWAAFFNFLAAFCFGTGVAKTVSEKLIDPHAVDVYVVFGGLVGAIAWNLLTWWLALPTSSSHALISGYAGAAIAKAGFGVILLKGWAPVLLFLVLSPLVGLVLGWAIMTSISWLTYRLERHRAERGFRYLQLFSAAAYSLCHGTNDAQKTMGIIAALLVAGGHQEWTIGHLQTLCGHHSELAPWIVLCCNGAMALGTMAGGWRVVKTMGSRITPNLRPVGGFSAECAAAASIALATFAHTPISTTHAIAGGIAGVGAARGARAVRWQWGKQIALAWILTFPGAAFIGALAYGLAHWAIEPFFPPFSTG
jgi:inorganic phosphate transporter, PiT family